MGTLDADYARFDYAGIGDISDRAEAVWAPELTYNIGGAYRINGSVASGLSTPTTSTPMRLGDANDFGTYNFQYGPEILIDDSKSRRLSDLSARQW